jgi:hypothetical protein
VIGKKELLIPGAGTAHSENIPGAGTIIRE